MGKTSKELSIESYDGEVVYLFTGDQENFL